LHKDGALNEWEYDRVEEAFIPAQIPDDPIEAVRSAVVDASTGANVYVVGSGWGDGLYATYVGRSADGALPPRSRRRPRPARTEPWAA
jgi:hypothetical protein